MNPRIYTAFENNGYNAFHDDTSGNNGAFAARIGFDDVTEIGSPKGYFLSRTIYTRTATVPYESESRRGVVPSRAGFVKACIYDAFRKNGYGVFRDIATGNVGHSPPRPATIR